MVDDNTCIWPGISGKEYKYWYYPMEGTRFKNEPGNYIFAHLTVDGWVADHIGISGSLRDRCCSTHEKWARAKKHGATHIHCHTNPRGDEAMRAEEEDLTALYDPPCNDL